MKSRTSFFNKTVLSKDITRFAPVWIVYASIMLMSTLNSIPLSLFQSGYMAFNFGNSISAMAITNMIYAIVCAIFLFGDLFNGRLCNALHALPLRRESWFATHILAGFLFSIVPNTAIALLNLPFLGSDWFIAPLWLGSMVVQFLFFFSLAAVCIMLTGSRFAAATVYVIINVLAPLCFWFYNTYYSPLMPGLHIRDAIYYPFCPVAFLLTTEWTVFQEVESFDGLDYIWSYRFDGLGTGWWYMALLAGLALALLGLGLWLYRKRALETAGDFLSFRKIQPPFLVIFALAIGAIFQGIFGLVGGGIISMLIGLAIGCYAGQMLLRRTVQVFDKRSLIWCGSIVGAMALSLLITVFDPLGLTRWQPEPEQVESIILSDNYEYSPDDEEYYGYFDSITVTDPQQVQELIDIHGLLIKDKFAYDLDLFFLFDQQIGAMHLTYQLQNGEQIDRRYYYRVDSDAGKKLEKYFGSPQYILGYDDWDTYLADIGYVELERFGTDPVELTDDQSLSLMEAVKADCENGTFLREWDEDTDLQLTIYNTQGEYVNSFPINSSSTQTYNWVQTNYPDLTL